MRKTLRSFFLVGSILSSLPLTTYTLAQQRYLVSSKDEIIPLKNGANSKTILQKHIRHYIPLTSSSCPPAPIFGYIDDPFGNMLWGARHRDVLAQWFVSKVTGRIDTIWWMNSGELGAFDSTVYVSVHRSNIGPSRGPGIRPGPYDPPCQNWGYFTNYYDLDQGIAAFPYDATDTTWHSTYNGLVPSFVPFTDVLWGYGGVPVRIHPESINSVAISSTGQHLNVTAGDQFVISLRMKGIPDFETDNWTHFIAEGFRVAPSDEDYPSRFWKFYEHDSTVSNCSGNIGRHGWVARGGFRSDGNPDSLDVVLLSLWYSITITSNIPPSFGYIHKLRNTFSSGPQQVTATIYDCDSSNPAKAGVKDAKLVWQLNGVAQPDIQMQNIGGDVWSGMIPGESVSKTVTYKVMATDSGGLATTSFPWTYKIVSLYSPYYLVDTGVVCTQHDIRTSGTSISFENFYLPPTAPVYADKKNDGSYGPIDMGHDFTHFGERYRYAWIGLNGAIALSNNPTDTVDVSANGIFAQYDFPTTVVRHDGRSDTAHVDAMPSNFIAPFWNDLWVGDITFTCDGHVAYGNDGDTCLFIVEWDSLGSFGWYGPACDEMTFRVVLNRCEGTIEFEYDDVGTLGSDTTALVGMGGDSTYEYIAVNDGYPASTRPRNGKCFKFYPAAVAITHDGWNMISIGVTPLGGDYHKTALYPTAKSDAFYYQGQYKAVGSSVMFIGQGYWLKFAGVQRDGPYGTLVMSHFNTVTGGWNMVGAIGTPVLTTTIVQSTPGMIKSNYYSEGGFSGYFTTSVLKPGYSYWVKSSASGTLFLNGFVQSVQDKSVSATNLNVFSKLTIMDGAGHQQVLYIGDAYLMKEQLESYEMPPAMMEFDARFASQRMVETYPSQLEKGARLEYPLAISSGFAAKIVYEMNRVTDRQFVLTADGKTVAILNGAGVVTLDANVKNAALIVSEGAQIPKAFALSQNYPNPFNPTTRLNYDMPKTAIVDIAVYDVLGRKIATLYSGEKSEGRHTIEWNGTDAHGISVPTGVYFIRMKANEFDATRKVLLMK